MAAELLQKAPRKTKPQKLPHTVEGTVPLENFQGHRKTYKTESSTTLLYTNAPHNLFPLLLYRLFYKIETMMLLTLLISKDHLDAC